MLVAVIKHQDVDDARGGGADDVGIVLGAEPVDETGRIATRTPGHVNADNGQSGKRKEKCGAARRRTSVKML